MFGIKFGKALVPLKPFLLKIRDGYLLGLAQDPSKGSPCAGCIQLWLQDRKIWCEPAELSELPRRRELIAELMEGNSAHVFYEIYRDGSEVKLESIVYPHPSCVCEKLNYAPPKEVTKRVNFAFSPIYQLKISRFATSEGNVWLATAVGDAPVTKKTITAFGVSDDKDAARFQAVDEWTKKAIQADLKARLDLGEVVPSEILQTGNVELITKSQERKSTLEGMGVGSTRDEAILDALISLAKVRTLKKYSLTMKNPMLVVGTNNWIRTKLPFFVLQQYDVHLLFYPNSTQAWVMGLAAVSRQNVDEKPIFVFAADSDVKKAVDKLFHQLIVALKPVETEAGPSIPEISSEKKDPKNSKLHLWWTHWLYRCPKISLKDVLQLDAYPRSVDAWKSYFRDGQELVQVLSVNNPHLPVQLRTVVKLQINMAEQQTHNVRSIMGIGTWNDFSDALA